MGSHLWRKIGKNVIYDKVRVNGETNYDYSSIYKVHGNPCRHDKGYEDKVVQERENLKVEKLFAKKYSAARQTSSLC